ncbi:MAG: hypothetical protein ABSA42_02485 [Terracidiphilus sp.]|jgi:hypothetical protein
MADKPKILGPVETSCPANSSPALANHAIARCARAWEDAYRTEMEESDSEYLATKKAGEAYRAALPPLTSRDDCRDFIACVAHGILLGAIPATDAGKLLYAAQVALGAVGAEEKSREMAGYAIYASLSASETARVKKFMPQQSKIS